MVRNTLKESDVPLEDALELAGEGFFTHYVTFAMGSVFFSVLLSLQGPAVVMPAAGCDLQLTNTQIGVLTSTSFTGMMISGQLFGFLADTIGRQRIMFWCQLVSMVVVVLSSMATDIVTWALLLFINGFVVTGAITPAYVYLSEFCPLRIRPRALLVMTAIGALGNVYLPSMAWLIMPIDIYVPLVDGLVFSSWRLYILLLGIPILLSSLLLWKLPETPKFLLSQRRHDESLEVLKGIFAVNQRKDKQEFPVFSVRLDSGDQTSERLEDSGNQFFLYLKMMFHQTIVLFSKKYVINTLISCGLLFGEVGVINSLVFWFPEVTSKIRQYSQSHDNYNATICELMDNNSEQSSNCQLNYDFFTAGIILGTTQVVACVVTGLAAHKHKKLLLSVSMFMCSAVCATTVYLYSEYIIIGSLLFMIVVLFVVYPLTVGVIVDLFPTPLRSTAASITMSVGRLSSAIGIQIMGLLYQDHCNKGYFGLSLVLFGILCILIPIKKRPS